MKAAVCGHAEYMHDPQPRYNNTLYAALSVALSFFVPRLTADTIHGTDTVAFVMLAYATHYAALQLHT